MKNVRSPLFVCLCTVALAFSCCTLDKEPEIPAGVNNIENPANLTGAVIPEANKFLANARLDSLGNLTILHHGWVWSETAEPTVGDDSLDLGQLEALSFSTEIAGLDTGKIYYLRPYVINGCGVFYGKDTCSFLGSNITLNTDTEIFQGADVQFSTGPLHNCTYMWEFGDGDTSTAASPKHTFNKDTGDVTVRLTAKITGCAVTQVMAMKIVPDPFADYWAPVPGGAFTMGCTDVPYCNGNEVPAHQVTLTAFFMGKTEVTQQQWLAVLGDNPSFFKPCGLDCPVERVSWDDIKEKFIPALYRKTGRMHRLPSEAEWEYAASGGQSFKYAGSDNLALVGWYDVNSNSTTHPVNNKTPNGYGLYDMSGNVQEWVEDGYHNSYIGAPADGSAWIDTPTSANRVYRGGCWVYPSGFCRVVFRDDYSTPFQANFLGLRLAR